MKGITFLFVLATAGMASAEPCVGNGYDIPLEGATNTKMVYVDVPSARAPSHWQEGQLGGYFYRLYSNQTAELSTEQHKPKWKIFTDCQSKDSPCEVKITGTPPDDAGKISEQLGACLQGAEIKEEAEAKIDEAPAEPCGLALVEDQDPISKLQRLVTLAGNDVGEIDGIYGPKTESAVLKELPDIEVPIDIEKATIALDEKLCLAPKTNVPPEV